MPQKRSTEVDDLRVQLEAGETEKTDHGDDRRRQCAQQQPKGADAAGPKCGTDDAIACWVWCIRDDGETASAYRTSNQGVLHTITEALDTRAEERQRGIVRYRRESGCTQIQLEFVQARKQRLQPPGLEAP